MNLFMALRAQAQTAAAPQVVGKLSRDNFGIHYIRWPYDPAVDRSGKFSSANPSRWQDELGDSVGWLRSFDPNLFGRYIGGRFARVGITAESSPQPYGRMEGGTWWQGMLRSDGSHDFSKLDLLLKACEAKGLKLLMCIGAQGAYYDETGHRYIEYPLPTGEYATTDWAGYQARYAAFMAALLDHAGARIAALEIANEPGRLVRLNKIVGAGHTEQLAVMCRIAKQLVRARGLATRVLSPPFQGGEFGEITAFLRASAQGLAINGDDGGSTSGRDWVDVLAHHNYGSFRDRGAGGVTAAMDAAGINDPAADAAYPDKTSFTDLLNKGRAVRAAALAGGWKGPMWNTEFNVTGQISTAAWFPRKMTAKGLARIFRQALDASFDAGYERCFLYAADHPTLGLYDNVGTPPRGEPADWYFKAPDNTARGAAALASAIAALTER